MEITQHRSRRRRKNSHGEQNTVSIDRLSGLPDSVLCHILSFLPTKISGRTSILARRWRYLWSYVLTLDFDYIHNPDIISRVMLLHRVYSLNTLRIVDWVGCCSDYQMETWIHFAIVRNVQNIDFRINFFGNLPQCIFTSKTLVYLRLDFCNRYPISGPFCLPRLKKLHLLNPTSEAEESLPHLLSCCPVLEELIIGRYSDIFVCKVTSATIKRLVVRLVSNGHTSNMLEINAPSLEYLRIRDSYSRHIKSEVLTSLIEADINIFSDNEQDILMYSRLLLEFIGRLCNVKRLKLDLSDCTEVIDSVLSPWTICFHNLTKLELVADCRFLSKFLELADNLEILIFTEEFCRIIEGWMEPPPQKVPPCLLSHLRIIKIADIRGTMHEFEIIRYLLRNAQILETMEIECTESLDSERQIYIYNEISQFQRGSKACEVVVVQDE